MPIASILGDIERIISEDLYPYRYIITPLIVFGFLGLVALGTSRGAHLLIWRHRVASAAAAIPLLLGAALAGDYLLSPLWERSFLEEAPPAVAVAGDQVTGRLAAGLVPSGAPATRSGKFVGADDFHFGRGDAHLLGTTDGKTVVRFENFSVRNGPDLYVYLSHETSGQRVDESLNLGKLKATDGAFNYELPASIDPSSVRSVVVWCRQFSVLFAIAELGT